MRITLSRLTRQKKNDTRHLIEHIVFFTREKSDTRQLIGIQLLRPACERKFILRLFSG